MKKIIAVNAGPRMGWNTDTLVTEASKGAGSAGATIGRYDLFRLEKYTGCISCFGCKREKNKAHCVCKDGLTILFLNSAVKPPLFYSNCQLNCETLVALIRKASGGPFASFGCKNQETAGTCNITQSSV